LLPPLDGVGFLRKFASSESLLPIGSLGFNHYDGGGFFLAADLVCRSFRFAGAIVLL
jgi:hypothetical protein